MNNFKEFFKLEQRGTTVKKEFIAGLTTFLAMAYILFVNASTLSGDSLWAPTGMEGSHVFTATAIAAIVGTLIMGLIANFPVALAPGMGMNAFFAGTVVLTLGYSWQQALAGIFISGIIFLILSLSGVREAIINAIPQDLKYAVGAGIGLFIAFIGFQSAGIIESNPGVLVQLGDLSNPVTLLAVLGLVVTVILYLLKVPGAIILGMFTTATVGLIFSPIVDSVAQWPSSPSGFMSMPAMPDFLALIEGFTDGVWDYKFIIVIFTFLFVDFFDTAGTLVTVGQRAGLIKDNKLQGSGRALLADSTATVVGSVVGTSSTTSYIESLAGVEAGGRTGLTSVFTSIFFLFAILFSPMLALITAPVTAPALILVGILMASQLTKVNWDDLAIAIPAFLTVVMMPLTYSIATGIAVGFVFYPITMFATKRFKNVNWLMYILWVVFILYFISDVIIKAG